MVPELLTPRLRLRPPRSDDEPVIVALHGDPDVMRFIDDGRPVSPEAVRSRDLGWLLADHGDGLGYWIAEERPSGATVGWWGLRPSTSDGREAELGYRLRPQWWGRGLASEGATRLVAYAFDVVGVERVFATTMMVNVGSRRVMERAGLRHVRTFCYDGPDPIPGAEAGDVEHALTRAEWRSRDPAEQG